MVQACGRSPTAWNNAFHLLTSGNFYVQKITNGKGDTIAMMLLKSWTVTVRYDRT